MFEKFSGPLSKRFFPPSKVFEFPQILVSKGESIQNCQDAPIKGITFSDLLITRDETLFFIHLTLNSIEKGQREGAFRKFERCLALWRELFLVVHVRD